MSESHTNDSTASSFALLSVLPSCSYTLRDVLVTLREDGDDEDDDDDNAEVNIQEATLGSSASRNKNNNKTTPFALCRGPQYIGGNRLGVLCDMQSLDPHMRRDEYLATAHDVVQIMRRDYQAKFVLVDNSISANNGRAANTNNDGDGPTHEQQQQQSLFGLELTPQLAQEFVAHLLQAKQPALPLLHSSSANSSVVTNTTAVSNSGGSSNMMTARPMSTEPIGSMPSAVATDHKNTTTTTALQDDEDAKKRRRRSSLLRRSVTDDGQAVSMKKSIQNFQKALFGSGGSDANKLRTTTSMEPLDVIFNVTQTTLIPSTPAKNYAGNNRLDVLISIKEEPFRTASRSQQEATVTELYQAVTESWGGRFLAEQANVHKQQWLVLDQEGAKLGLKRLLDPDSVPQAAPLSTVMSSSPVKPRPSLLKLKNPLPGLLQPRPSLAVSASGGDGHQPSQRSSLAQEDKLRLAAVASLQRRKKRQGLTSKIRKLTTNLLTKGSATASSSSAQEQQDRFAEANFDTAPPKMARAASERDEYGAGGGSNDYNNVSVGRRTSMGQTPSQDLMPPPPRQRQGHRSDYDESFSRRGSSKSFNASFSNVHNESWYDSGTGQYHEEVDELAEKARNVAGVDGYDDDEEDDGGMLAILQRQLLAKAAAEAADAQRHHLPMNGHRASPTVLDAALEPRPLPFGHDASMAAQMQQQQGEPLPYTYHAVMPPGPLLNSLPRMQVDKVTPIVVPTFPSQIQQQQQQQQQAMYQQQQMYQPQQNHQPQHYQQQSQPSQLQQAASFESAMFVKAKARMSGQRFSGIGELDDEQLESLLTGLDVSESDLNYNPSDDAPQHAQV